jgi:hypothetical protein
MTLAMSNEPVTCIVLAASLKRYIVADIPFFAGDNLPAA